MRILLDTHIFLWYINKDRKLSKEVRDLVRDPDNEIYLSVISIWESIIKYQSGKLPFPESPEIYLPKQRERHLIESLILDENSLAKLVSLPYLHRDPFDRMLICQALQHNLIIATVDRNIRSYSVNCINEL